MIFDISFSSIENVNNDIQISIAQNCKPGQRIVTETLDERPRDKDGNSLFTVHPTHSWLEKSSDNYYPMKGTLKVWFKCPLSQFLYLSLTCMASKLKMDLQN